jgi:hypothetical protein
MGSMVAVSTSSALSPTCNRVSLAEFQPPYFPPPFSQVFIGPPPATGCPWQSSSHLTSLHPSPRYFLELEYSPPPATGCPWQSSSHLTSLHPSPRYLLELEYAPPPCNRVSLQNSPRTSLHPFSQVYCLNCSVCGLLKVCQIVMIICRFYGFYMCAKKV